MRFSDTAQLTEQRFTPENEDDPRWHTQHRLKFKADMIGRNGQKTLFCNSRRSMTADVAG
jgi:hypothetical protein